MKHMCTHRLITADHVDVLPSNAVCAIIDLIAASHIDILANRAVDAFGCPISACRLEIFAWTGVRSVWTEMFFRLLTSVPTWWFSRHGGGCEMTTRGKVWTTQERARRTRAEFRQQPAPKLTFSCLSCCLPPLPLLWRLPHKASMAVSHQRRNRCSLPARRCP